MLNRVFDHEISDPMYWYNRMYYFDAAVLRIIAVYTMSRMYNVRRVWYQPADPSGVKTINEIVEAHNLTWCILVDSDNWNIFSSVPNCGWEGYKVYSPYPASGKILTGTWLNMHRKAVSGSIRKDTHSLENLVFPYELLTHVAQEDWSE